MNTPASYFASSALKFASTDLATLYSKIYAYHDAENCYLVMSSLYSDNALINRVSLIASNSGLTTNLIVNPILGGTTFSHDARIAGGLYVGALNVDPGAGEILCTGAITTSTGAITATAGNIVAAAGNLVATNGALIAGLGNAWKLGAYHSGAPTPDGYVTITVDGAAYRLPAYMVPA
jgi:hypothetical protein